MVLFVEDFPARRGCMLYSNSLIARILGSLGGGRLFPLGLIRSGQDKSPKGCRIKGGNWIDAVFSEDKNLYIYTYIYSQEE